MVAKEQIRGVLEVVKIVRPVLWDEASTARVDLWDEVRTALAVVAFEVAFEVACDDVAWEVLEVVESEDCVEAARPDLCRRRRRRCSTDFEESNSYPLHVPARTHPNVPPFFSALPCPSLRSRPVSKATRLLPFSSAVENYRRTPATRPTRRSRPYLQMSHRSTHQAHHLHTPIRPYSTI